MRTHITMAFLGNLSPFEWILILCLLVLFLSLTRSLWEPDLVARWKGMGRFFSGN